MAQEHPFLAVLGGICGSPWARVAGVLQKHLPGVEKIQRRRGAQSSKSLAQNWRSPTYALLHPLLETLESLWAF